MTSLQVHFKLQTELRCVENYNNCLKSTTNRYYESIQGNLGAYSHYPSRSSLLYLEALAAGQARSARSQQGIQEQGGNLIGSRPIAVEV